LGQVLVNKNDFVITDLEGEPNRPLAERRRKHTVLKDIAAMTRSFDYARVVAARQLDAKPHSGRRDVGPLLVDWREQVHEVFLSSYREALGDSPVLPSDEAVTRRWLALARIERLLYEIRYELTHRPEQVVVPLLDLIDRA
jgi:maltose alpha-D-glucosyltransferase/alpha-amylase